MKINFSFFQLRSFNLSKKYNNLAAKKHGDFFGGLFSRKLPKCFQMVSEEANLESLIRRIDDRIHKIDKAHVDLMVFRIIKACHEDLFEML